MLSVTLLKMSVMLLLGLVNYKNHLDLLVYPLKN
jgi:hypothetical protein